MTIVRVKGFQIFTDRHGKPRYYHRKMRQAIDLDRAPIGSAEFFTECARITALSAATAPKPGTLGKLIVLYRAHAAFTDLAPQAQADYQKVFDYLKPIADMALATFNRPLVVWIRDRAAEMKGRRFANYVKAVLSILFGWSSERGHIAANPAAGIKDIRRKKGEPERNRPWTDSERDAVLDADPAHMRQRSR